MRVRFWGVRGSLPVPGAKTERYGGNTSCVEVRSAAGTRVVVDAGTGIRKLGKELASEGEAGHARVHLLISHTHWDHIQGLPYFAPLYQRGNKMSVYARKRDDLHLQAVFASQTHDPYFPVPFEEADAAIEFNELTDAAQVLHRRRPGRVRAAQPPVHRDRLPPDRGRRLGRLRVRHRPVLRHPVRGRVRRAAAVAGRRAAREGPAEARAHARGRGTAVRGSGPGHLRHDVHERGLPAHPALRPLAPDGRGRGLRRGGRLAPGAVPSRARTHRRRDRHDPRPHARDRATRRRSSWRSSPRTKDWTWSWGSADGARLLGRARLDPRAGAGDGALRRQHRLRVGAPSSGGLIILDCGTGARNLGITLLEVRSARAAARRASCSRTPTGITSRASRSSCRSTGRATASTSSAAPRARRCWKGSSRGRWRRSTSPCRR